MREDGTFEWRGSGAIQPSFCESGAMTKSFRVGVDSYSLSPLKLSPFEVLDWAAAHNADGVQFTELHLRQGQPVDGSFLTDLAEQARARNLYLEWGGAEHIPFDTTTWQRKDLLPVNTTAAQQASALGVTTVRSCSGGLMRWKDDAPPTETLLRETASALKAQSALLTDLNVVLAIETHFEFTTFELLRMFDMCDAEPGGCLGVCLDTMNLLTMLEDPLAGTERILPWVVAVHAKDGGLQPNDSGLVSFPTGIGAGCVDFDRILARLAMLNRAVHLSIEDHGGRFEIPIYDPVFLSRFPDLTAIELARLMQLAYEGLQRVRAGDIAPIARSEWRQHCETRLRDDVANMKRIVARQGKPAVASE
jgi:sugar phosphate isomerase/epimerase